MNEPTLQMMSDVAPGNAISKRKRTVAELMVTDGLTIHQAVKAAGFSEKRNKQTVYELRHDEAWVRYLNHRTVLHAAEQTARAVYVRGNLMETAESEKVRLDAAKDVLDRNGFRAPDRKISTGGVTIAIDLG